MEFPAPAFPYVHDILEQYRGESWQIVCWRLPQDRFCTFVSLSRRHCKRWIPHIPRSSASMVHRFDSGHGGFCYYQHFPALATKEAAQEIRGRTVKQDSAGSSERLTDAGVQKV